MRQAVRVDGAPLVGRRRRAEHLGEVDAPDEQAAIKRAAKVFDIPPERQNRISVRKLGKGEK